MACAVRCRGWRSSSSRTGASMNGRTTPSGSASSSARSIDASAARRIAELVAGDGVEQQRVDGRPARMSTCAERLRAAPLDHGRQHAPPRPPGGPRASSSAAAAMRIPARSRSSGSRAASAARAAAVSPIRTCVCTIQPRTSTGSACSPCEQRLHPLRGAELRQRFLEPTLRRGAAKPRAWWRTGSVSSSSAGRCAALHAIEPLARPRRSGRATRARLHRRRRPERRSDAFPIRAPRRSPPPRSLSRSPSGTASRRDGAAIARWPRQPTSRYGRPIRRASASASSRSRRASSSCSDHSSAMPRFISADARWSLLRGRSRRRRGCAPPDDRIACPRRGEIAALAREPRAARWPAAGRSAAVRSVGHRRGKPLGDGDVGGAVVEQAVDRAAAGERQRPAPRRPSGASAGKAASSARSVAMRPSSTRST